MKYVALFIVFLRISDSCSQTTSSHHLFEATTFSFEQKCFLSDFGRQLKTLNQYEISKPCNYVTLAIMGDKFTIGRGYDYPGYFAFSYLLPADIIVNDSINEDIKGFNLKLSFAGQSLIHRKHLGIFLTEGWTFGRLKLVNEDKQKLKNPILAPFIGLVIRATIKRLSFFAISEFNYDLSSAKWKKTWVSKKQQESIPGFKQGGLNFSIGVNFSLNKIYLTDY